MARIATLICVLGVLSLSTSAFATMITITDDEPANDASATATLLTATRVSQDPIGGVGTLAIDAADTDYFKFDLQAHDYLMVNTFAMGAGATTVAVYDSGRTLIPSASTGTAGYIASVPASGSYYIGVTGSGTAPYMMSFSVDYVPEPATMSLLAIGCVALLKRRRKR